VNVDTSKLTDAALALTDPRSALSKNSARLAFLEAWGILRSDERISALTDPLVYKAAHDIGVAVAFPNAFVRERLGRDLSELISLAEELRIAATQGGESSIDAGAQLLSRSAKVLDDISTLWHLSKGSAGL
jgi:hypothetical protein